MSLSLFHRPGGFAFVDDDFDYLEMLALVLPRDWHLRLFLRPVQCIQAILRELRQWESDTWAQQRIVEGWRAGRPLIPQVLAYWAANPDRYALTHVCVVDFFMPGMDGMQVLSELVGWPGARVLLTGQADERIAVGAFNRRLIDHYIPKHSPDITDLLVRTLGQLSDRAHDGHNAIWRATLQPWQQALLREPVVAAALDDVIRSRWVEYVVLGEPFGVLGMDVAGRVGWLQLETAAGLPAMAELAELEGLDVASLQAVRSGKSLVSLELRQSLGLGRRCEVAPATALGPSTALLGALFSLEPEALPPGLSGHQAWLARQPGRQLIG